MKRIESFVGRAQKLNEDGDIEYCLWVGSDGEFYVQFLSNTRNGTCSTNCSFKVSEYRDQRTQIGALEVTGYDTESGNRLEEDSCNNNDGAFLKAVLQDLIPQ
ncbi:MAG: hypothetical protein Q9O24_11705 [Gammaproteobacteria bacterium]|nr:hypothetical protein [Gammaproteobacteria bacterium]